MILISGSAAIADGMTSLMGWPYGSDFGPGLNYATQSAASTDTIPRRISNIVYPVIGLPALVEPESELTVIVYFAENEAYLDPDEWQLQISTGFKNPDDSFARIGDRVVQSYELALETIAFDDATSTYHISCRIPATAPRDLYTIVVSTNLFWDFQPAAVRIQDEIGDSFSFVHFTDAQPTDIRTMSDDNEWNAHNYPGSGLGERGYAIFTNEIKREFSLLQPAFAVFTGDMVYNAALVAENDESYRIIQDTQVPLFLTNGNHDGYARFNGPDVRQDGLEFFNRFYGPNYYSFDVGSVHFVVLNSYDGDPARRHAGQLIVATPVDNWGGFLSEKQLAWVEADLADAQSRGQTSLLFMHHDPRGPYTADQPYPTSPIAGDGEEYWNYESSEWDSDPTDDIHNETPAENTGTRLLSLALTHGVTHLFIGHNHFDGIWEFQAGDPLTDRFGDAVGGLSALQPFTVVQTTACAGNARGTGGDLEYNGYRWVQVENGDIVSLEFNAAANAQSIPAGNFWLEDFNNDGRYTHAQVIITNALPDDLGVEVEFYLAGIANGYQILDERTQLPLSFTDLGLGQNGELVVYARATAKGTGAKPADFPPAPGQEAKTMLTSRPHPTNQQPIVSFTMAPTNEEFTYTFDAADSVDPEGGELLYFWDFGDGRLGTGQTITHHYIVGGPNLITLTVVDPFGGMAATQSLLELADCCPDRDHDTDEDLCGECGMTGGTPDYLGFASLLAVAAFVFALRSGARKRS